MAFGPGTQLGRYTVVKPLVTGGMADVWLARATGMVGFQHHVVIKCIHADAATDPQFISMFLDEARLAASLHHHHIVQVHDVGREGADYFFAMEYVHGENLRQLLTKVARAGELVPLDQVVTITIAVASALHHAHQQNIVHRDVTPANILVGYDGNVKVVDFGIAKAVLRSSEATKSASMRGKVAYMAPEQCLGRPLDRRSDIFSLGVVLYELCTSRRLFKGDTDFLLMSAIVNGKIPKPTLHRHDLPVELEDVILKALAPKPELRFETAEALAYALEGVAAASGIRISAAALAEYMRRSFGQRPEPWLSDDTTSIERVDVDFDGHGTGLATIGDDDNPTVRHELLESPFLAAATQTGVDDDDDDDDANEFDDEPRTDLVDPEEAPTNLADGGEVEAAVAAAKLLRAGGTPPRAQRPTRPARKPNPFEGGEQTLIGEQADVDVLRQMSKIESRRDATPLPLRAPPEPVLPHARMPTPIPLRGEPTPIPQPRPAAWASPDGAVTGTPMSWVNDGGGDVPSLAPKGRRAILIAAVALPLVLVGGFIIVETTSSSKRTTRSVLEPDAALPPDAAAPAIDAAVPDAAVAPDAAPKPATTAPAKPAVHRKKKPATAPAR